MYPAINQNEFQSSGYLTDDSVEVEKIYKDRFYLTKVESNERIENSELVPSRIK